MARKLRPTVLAVLSGVVLPLIVAAAGVVG